MHIRGTLFGELVIPITTCISWSAQDITQIIYIINVAEIIFRRRKKRKDVNNITPVIYIYDYHNS